MRGGCAVRLALGLEKQRALHSSLLISYTYSAVLQCLPTPLQPPDYLPSLPCPQQWPGLRLKLCQVELTIAEIAKRADQAMRGQGLRLRCEPEPYTPHRWDSLELGAPPAGLWSFRGFTWEAQRGEGGEAQALLQLKCGSFELTPPPEAVVPLAPFVPRTMFEEDLGICCQAFAAKMICLPNLRALRPRPPGQGLREAQAAYRRAPGAPALTLPTSVALGLPPRRAAAQPLVMGNMTVRFAKPSSKKGKGGGQQQQQQQQPPPPKVPAVVAPTANTSWGPASRSAGPLPASTSMEAFPALGACSAPRPLLGISSMRVKAAKPKKGKGKATQEPTPTAPSVAAACATGADFWGPAPQPSEHQPLKQEPPLPTPTAGPEATKLQPSRPPALALGHAVEAGPVVVRKPRPQRDLWDVVEDLRACLVSGGVVCVGGVWCCSYMCCAVLELRGAWHLRGAEC
jgi:hypothetical protein